MGRRNLETNTDEIAGLKIIANLMEGLIAPNRSIAKHYAIQDKIDNMNPEQSNNVSKALYFINGIM